MPKNPLEVTAQELEAMVHRFMAGEGFNPARLKASDDGQYLLLVRAYLCGRSDMIHAMQAWAEQQIATSRAQTAAL